MTQKIKVIIGASYGDEGKGLATDYFGAQGKKKGTVVNVLTNGGPQRGHTVELPDGTRHVFRHFGAASFRGAASYMAQQFIINPIELIGEYDELCHIGIAPEIMIHPDCRFTTPWDMLVNQKLKKKNGINNTCGFGVWETVLRYDRGYGTQFIKMVSMDRNERISCLRSLRDGYFMARIKELSISLDKDDVFFSDGLLRHFEEDLASVIMQCRMTGYAALRNYETVLFENAQGLLLDGNRKGEEDFTTPSTTGMGRIFRTIEDNFHNVDVEVCYVTRSYQTRHGEGVMEQEYTEEELLKVMPGLTADMTNIRNDFQGALRYGRLSEDSLIRRIEKDMEYCADGKKNLYLPSVLVTHMNEYNGIDTEKLVNAFKTVRVSDGKTAEDVHILA